MDNNQPAPNNDVQEYQTALHACYLAMRILLSHDLPKMLNAISKAEATGPILDPTKYKERSEAMGEDKKVLEAALALWRQGKEMEKTIATRST